MDPIKASRAQPRRPMSSLRLPSMNQIAREARNARARARKTPLVICDRGNVLNRYGECRLPYAWDYLMVYRNGRKFEDAARIVTDPEALKAIAEIERRIADLHDQLQVQYGTAFAEGEPLTEERAKSARKEFGL